MATKCKTFMNRGVKFKYCWKVDGENKAPEQSAKPVSMGTTTNSKCTTYNHHSGSFRYCPSEAKRDFNTLGSGIIKLFSGFKSILGID